VAPRARKTDKPVKLTDPRAIRALAHPARLAVIDELYAGRQLTATELAQVAGLSPSAMSYHLRSLEKAGIVERAPTTGDGRERPWRAAGTSLHVENRSGRAGDAAASAALNSTMLGRVVAEVEAWYAQRGRETPDWLDAAGSTFGREWLLPHEAKEFETQFQQLLERYRHRTRDNRPDGSRRVRLVVLVYPTDEPKSPSDHT